jgi:putative transposase
MLSVVTDAQAHDELRLDLDAIVREGARRMLAAALEAEIDDYLAAHAAERDEPGRRLVVRNGHAASARSRPWPGASRCVPRGWTTARRVRKCVHAARRYS